MERDIRMDGGLFYRLFSESFIPFAIMDENGSFVLANRQLDRIVEALGSSKQAIEAALRAERDFADLLSGRSKQASSVLDFQSWTARTVSLRFDGWHIGEWKQGDASAGESFFALQIKDEPSVGGLPPEAEQDGVSQFRSFIEAQTAILSSLSQEATAPLDALADMAKALSKTSLNPEQAEYSRQILFCLGVLRDQIQDIFEYAKSEMELSGVEHHTFNLEDAIEQGVDGAALEAAAKGLELALDLPLEMDAIALGDGARIRQLITMLVKEGIRNTAEGGVMVTPRFVALDGVDSKEGFQLTVEGGGLRPPGEIAGKLSQNLVELMGGTLERRISEEGQGFICFAIPLERSSPAPPSSVTRLDTRVLVVDDRAESRYITVQYLKDIGIYDIDVAISGEEALHVMRSAKSRHRPFQICLLDMSMPRMDGWRLAWEINRDREINDPALICLASPGALGEEGAMRLLNWYNGFVQKPLKRKELFAAIQSVLDAPPVDLAAVGDLGTESAAPQDTALGYAADGVQSARSLLALAGRLKPQGERIGASGTTTGSAAFAPGLPAASEAGGTGDAAEPPALTPPATTAAGGSDSAESAAEPTLPAASAPGLPAASEAGGAGEAESAAASAAASVQAGEPGKPLALVVEDNPVNQKLFSMILEKLGYPLLIADDGVECLKKTLAHSISFVFMDIQMPRMNGYETIKLLRKAGFAKPVIAVTASNKSEDWDACLEAGFDDVLFKPFKRQDLEKLLQRWVAVLRDNAPQWPGTLAEEVARFETRSAESAPEDQAPVEVEPPTPDMLENIAEMLVPPEVHTSQYSLPTIFSAQELIDSFVGNKEVLPSLIERFLSRTYDQIFQIIPQSIESEDLQTASREAHTIRGGAYTLSGSELGQTAARLEEALNARDETSIHSTLSLIQEDFSRFKREAELFMEQCKQEP